jgi:hypothetical protein
MRTTLDLPEPLLRQLKSQAALEGTTLKNARSELPSVKLGQPLRVKRLSNAALAELLDK